MEVVAGWDLVDELEHVADTLIDLDNITDGHAAVKCLEDLIEGLGTTLGVVLATAMSTRATTRARDRRARRENAGHGSRTVAARGLDLVWAAKRIFYRE